MQCNVVPMVLVTVTLAACGLPEDKTFMPGTLSVPLIATNADWTLKGGIVATPGVAEDSRCYATSGVAEGRDVVADLDNGEADFELNLGGGCWIVSLFDPVLVHTDGTTYQCTDSEDCSHYPEKAGVLIDGNAVVRYGAGAKDELCY